MARSPWWIVFGSFFGLSVANFVIYQFAFSVLIGPIAADFAWSRGSASSAVLAAGAAAALGTPLLGWAVDRFGIRVPTVLSIVLFALVIAALSALPASLPVFVTAFALLGLCSVGQAPLPYVKAISGAFDRRRGLALGVALAGVGLGTALVPRITQHLADGFGWRGAFLGLGLLVLVVALPSAALFLREPPRGIGVAAADLPGLTAAEAVRTRTFWLLAAVFAALPTVANGTIAHIVPLLVDRGLPRAAAVGVFASVGGSLVAGRLLSGYLLDRFFAPHVTMAFVAMPLAGLVLLWAADSQPAVLSGALLVGIGLGAEVDLIGYLQSRYLGLRAFGQVYGYLFAIFTLGGGLGPFLMGQAYDLAGSYRPALAGFAGLLCCALALLTRLARRYPYPVTEARNTPGGHSAGSLAARKI